MLLGSRSRALLRKQHHKKLAKVEAFAADDRGNPHQQAVARETGRQAARPPAGTGRRRCLRRALECDPTFLAEGSLRSASISLLSLANSAAVKAR